jgi:hypothetical protein
LFFICVFLLVVAHSLKTPKPFKKQVKYYNDIKPITTITAPTYYVIPATIQSAKEILDRFNISYYTQKQDSTAVVGKYKITGYKNASGELPYEGHYLHTNITTEYYTQKQEIKKGDYIIPTNQKLKALLGK